MLPADPISPFEDMPGVKVGHWSDGDAKTGCTVILFDKSSVASVHVSGGAPGSSETDLLDPSCLVTSVDAILLAGGSAFGLQACAGVRRYLEEKGRGFNAGGHLVPIVPAAVIFDLAFGDGSIRPGANEGYMACENAESSSMGEGAIGAGTGARVGKYMGMEKSAQGGFAVRGARLGDGILVGACMVANCYGAIVDPDTGKTVAGPVDKEGNYISYLLADPPPPPFGATAIGVVVTDARLSRADLKRVAIMAHDGLARSVYPSHTPFDGDMIFAVSVGDKKGDIAKIGAWAAKLVERSIVGAVTAG